MKEIKLQQLLENFINSESEMSFSEYVKRESENDPNFFRWFFDEEFDNDFNLSLSDEQLEEFNDFVNSL